MNMYFVLARTVLLRLVRPAPRRPRRPVSPRRSPLPHHADVQYLTLQQNPPLRSHTASLLGIRQRSLDKTGVLWDKNSRLRVVDATYESASVRPPVATKAPAHTAASSEDVR